MKEDDDGEGPDAVMREVMMGKAPIRFMLNTQIMRSFHGFLALLNGSSVKVSWESVQMGVTTIY